MLKFSDHFLIADKDKEVNLPGDFNFQLLGNYKLFTEQSLNVFKYKDEKSIIYLLGFAFHIENVNLNENNILSELPEDESELLNYLDYLCGNFVIIVKRGDDVFIYHDATATFKVYYYEKENKIISVASDISLIKYCFDLSKVCDKEVLDYYNSDFYIKKKNRPGEKTIYQNLFQLTPNKRIDLNKSEVIRYFPREKLNEKKMEESAIEVKSYFDNVLANVYKRYNVKCSLTAGWDSRMLLLLTKDFKDSTEYYTFKFERLNENSQDIRIPLKFAKKLKLNHKIIDFHNKKAKHLREQLKFNYELISDYRVNAISKGFSNFEKKKDIALLGTVSEICKNYYDKVIVKDGKTLTQAAHFNLNNYTINHFEEKYNELNDLCKKNNYSLTDIVHWEQDITNIAAQNTFHDKYVVDAFSPFNSRKIITTILSVPKQYRDKQNHKFYQYMFERYWPELNEIPVNPNLKTKLIKLSKKLKIYKPYKKLSTKLRR